METVDLKSREALKTYQHELEKELENILGFWQLNAIDEQHGGFIGQMDHQGNIQPDAPKGGILNARILWTFSAAYRHTQKEEYKKLAGRAYHYLLRNFLDKEYGGIYWTLDAKGNPLYTRKQIYALAFAIYGLSEFYLATREVQALEVARDLFRWIEKFSYDKEYGGYFEAFSREGELLDDLRLSPKDRNDPKTMNTHLHILEAYANLYRAWPDNLLAVQLESLINIFLQHIVDPPSGHLLLFFSREWTVRAELYSFGHDIEAAWLLLEAAEVLGNKVLIERVATVALKMTEAAMEGLQPDGSLYHEYDVAHHHFDRHREWWVSAEAMVGFLNAYQLSSNEQYLTKSLKILGVRQKIFIRQGKGEWRWGVHNDYSYMDQEDKVGFWKCPYHNGRACMEVINRCKHILNEMEVEK